MSIVTPEASYRAYWLAMGLAFLLAHLAGTFVVIVAALRFVLRDGNKG